MALGATLKLGYLEHGGDQMFCSGASAPGAADVASELESAMSFGGTLKLDDSGAQADESMQDSLLEQDTADEMPMQSLEWTKPPFTEVQKEANIRYQVSTPATTDNRAHNLHLVRSVRLEPRSGSSRPSRPLSRNSSRPSSRPSSRSGRPPSCPKKDDQQGRNEQIVVSESDLRRCGHSLTLLRQCNQMQPQSSAEDMTESDAQRNEMKMSFKSAFLNRCRTSEAPRNPWKDIENPEEQRDSYEKDLILNQVWTERLVPKKVEHEPEATDASQESSSPQRIRSTGSIRRTSSVDTHRASVDAHRLRRSASVSTRDSSGDSPQGVFQRLSMHRDEAEFRGRRGSKQRPPQPRAQSSGPIPEQTLREPRPVSRSRRGSHTSGCPRPGSTSTKQADDKQVSKYESRIKLIDSNDGEEDTVAPKGSLAVRTASVNQRRFERQVEEEPKTRTIWLSLDPLTGEVEFYPRAAAQRLESAHLSNKAHVPLAGLGGDLEWAIVHLAARERGHSAGCNYPTQVLNGEHRDVRRVTVPFDASEVCLRVLHSNAWRIADAGNHGDTEERRVSLSGTHFLRPPSPILPPVDPNRRLNYHNPGVDLHQ